MDQGIFLRSFDGSSHLYSDLHQDNLLLLGVYGQVPCMSSPKLNDA